MILAKLNVSQNDLHTLVVNDWQLNLIKSDQTNKKQKREADKNN